MNEKLLPCPGSPNCVNSEYQGTDSYIEPLSFSENSQTAWKNLKTTIENMGGTISKETPSYLRCTFTSKIFRFVDDVEFRMDEKLSQIHMRSASRKGYSDLGVNRNRMERLRKKFNQMRNNLQP